jgi:hypothetical protein
MAARTTGPQGATPGTHGPTIVGIFTDRPEAERAIQDLKAAGFTEEQIGVAMLDRQEQRQLIENTGGTAEAAATGAISGGIVGGLIGLLGSLLLPGAGPIVVGGVLASTLTGLGIGAAAGGLIGALMGMGVPEVDARHFDSGLRSGAVLVTVDAADRLPEALAILERHGVDLGPSRGERFRTTEAGAAGAGVADRERNLPPRDEPVVLEEEILVVERDAATGRTTRPDGGKERRRRQQPSYSGPERRELYL